ncbi:hypothetical protein R1flu_007146 [Riccia fluitans]|uniref:Uncharacterized protein n=1 Tax=Riccia fluitans TaxID=41844 RepID=A0ABD1Z125_9MARC
MKVHFQEVVKAADIIMPGSDIPVDLSKEGIGDATILAHRSVSVLDKGVSGEWFAAWIQIDSPFGPLGIVNLHAPGKKKDRVYTWM